MNETHSTSKVLVGTALTPHSDPPLRAAAEIARRTGAELHVLHAFSPPMAYFAAPAGLAAFDPQLLETELEVHRSLLDDQLRRLGISDDEVNSKSVVGGAPHRMIQETAAALHPDLIVIGSSEASQPRWLGSTADRVLRRSHRPVLITREGFEMPPRKILAPVDLSEDAEESLRRGMKRLKAWGWESLEAREIGSLFVLTTAEIDSSAQFNEEQLVRLAGEEIERFFKKFDAEGVFDVQPEVRVGDPREEILAQLSAKECDLVVLGTHGRGGFERFLLGSVAADVAGRASCSALVIPPRDPS